MSAYTQKYISVVKELLLKRVDLTTQTLIDLGCGWRLSSIIYVLRKRGWPIETRLDDKRIGHYRLKRGWRPKNQTPPRAGKGG